MKNLRLIIFTVCSILLTSLLTSCQPLAAAPTTVPAAAQPTATTAATQPPTATETTVGPKGDMIRGGKLYDNWWTETGKDAPKEDMALFKTQTTDKAKGASTWRCAECHGWDYKGVDGVYSKGTHMTGFKGVLASKGKDPAVIVAALKGKTNPDHDFSKVLAEQDLTDLALFIANGTMDVDAVLNADGSPKGTAADGEEKFEKVCAACHGPNGTAINFKTPGAVEYIGHPASENPWQFLHRMRIGIAVWPMPSAIDNKFTDKELADVLAYARTLPQTATSHSAGGQLYDKWYGAIGVTGPTGDMPLWKTQTTNARKGLSTWTCRECHGVDYKGAAGMYATGAHKTGFPGILDAQSKSETALTDALTGKVNPDHDYSKLLNADQIAVLVDWIKTDLFDVSKMVKADGKTVDGDIAHGKTIFDATCAQCHGKDGKLLNFKTPDSPEYVGTVAAEEAQVCLHRVAFGVPGFPMSAAIDLNLTHQDIADVCAYSQTLPIK